MKTVDFKSYRAEMNRIERQSEALFRAAAGRWEQHKSFSAGKPVKSYSTER
jgi:hypothetical protein